MTEEDARAIVANLPLFRQLARGKPVYFAAFRYDGKFMGWYETHKILLAPLRTGRYVVKPRYRYNGKKAVPVPYPEQQAREDDGKKKRSRNGS